MKCLEAFNIISVCSALVVDKGIHMYFRAYNRRFAWKIYVLRDIQGCWVYNLLFTRIIHHVILRFCEMYRCVWVICVCEVYA